jgi:hypothetical protein
VLHVIDGSSQYPFVVYLIGGGVVGLKFSLFLSLPLKLLRRLPLTLTILLALNRPQPQHNTTKQHNKNNVCQSLKMTRGYSLFMMRTALQFGLSIPTKDKLKMTCQRAENQGIDDYFRCARKIKSSLLRLISMWTIWFLSSLSREIIVSSLRAIE